MSLKTCVDPSGSFACGIHKPGFHVINLRENNYVGALGRFADNTFHENLVNFPPGTVEEPSADIIFEIPNPFPFRGVTYIAKSWAEEKVRNPSAIMLPHPPVVSFEAAVKKWFGKNQLTPEKKEVIFQTLPQPLQFALAETTTDPDDLICLANIACEFVFDEANPLPTGLRYRKNKKGIVRPVIRDDALYELVANNPNLPDDYKRVMVLRPGVQGGSEIVGEWSNAGTGGNTHVFEYLRRNSYIPWGHYAANMADDAVRYRVNDLSETDMQALRHLYYQRTFVRVAQSLGVSIECERRCMSVEELESLRNQISDALKVSSKRDSLEFNRTLWGWNFGFDFAPTKYRLHASHQQIHQQYAMVPAAVEIAPVSAAACDASGSMMSAFACGDLIADFIGQYRQQTGKNFFETYIQAINNNQRLDGKTKDRSLVILEDENIILFVPKAQTSQWEIQLMTRQPVGNILEADISTRRAIDYGILAAVQALEKMGAKMITCIEYSKSFNADDNDQRLLYSFMPRLPESPGAFSEAQLRWINGHYPEDFAAACRMKLLKK